MLPQLYEYVWLFWFVSHITYTVLAGRKTLLNQSSNEYDYSDYWAPIPRTWKWALG